MRVTTVLIPLSGRSQHGQHRNGEGLSVPSGFEAVACVQRSIRNLGGLSVSLPGRVGDIN